MRCDLHEGGCGNARARDASRGCCWSQGAPLIDQDAVRLREFALGRCDIQLRIVELVEPVLRKSDDVLGSGVLSHELRVIFVLRLPLLGCRRNLLIQSHNAGSKGLKLSLRACNTLFGVSDGLLEVGNTTLELLLLVIRRVKLCSAMLLLLLILDLLILQKTHHIVDHFNDFFETDLLPTEREGDEIQTRAVLP